MLLQHAACMAARPQRAIHICLQPNNQVKAGVAEKGVAVIGGGTPATHGEGMSPGGSWQMRQLATAALGGLSAQTEALSGKLDRS